jgi:hypothetical protein
VFLLTGAFLPSKFSAFQIMQGFAKARLYRILGSAGVTLGMACATLLALEVVLRACDFRELREGDSERSLGYRYDAELGWTAAPNSISCRDPASRRRSRPLFATERNSLRFP